MVNIELGVNLHNEVKVVVQDSKTLEIKQKIDSKNVIANAFINTLYGYAGKQVLYLFYGEGTGVPAKTDANLFKAISYTAIIKKDLEYDLESGVGKASYMCVIQPGTANGKTITEIALSSGTGLGSDTIINHCMLSSPITVGDLDQINITATISCSFPKNLALLNGQMKLSALFIGLLTGYYQIGYNLASAGNAYYRSQVCVTSAFSSTISKYYDSEKLSYTCVYDNNTHTLTSAFRFNINDGNFDQGIHQIIFTSAGYSNTVDRRNFFTLYVDKNCEWLDNNILTVKNKQIAIADGTKKDFMTPHYYVYDIVVYVDGIKTDAITNDNVLNQKFVILNEYTLLPGVGEHAYLNDDFFEVVEYSGKIHHLQHNYYGMKYSRNVGDYTVFKNKYPQYGIKTLYTYVDADFYYLTGDGNWVSLPRGVAITLPSEAVYAEYFKLVQTRNTQSYDSLYKIELMNPPTTNISFAEPPPAGSVITADYKLRAIPKTEDNVLDISFTLSVNAV